MSDMRKKTCVCYKRQKIFGQIEVMGLWRRNVTTLLYLIAVSVHEEESVLNPFVDLVNLGLKLKRCP